MNYKEEFIQYIVVRRDLVEQMGPGKLAAQCCHASLGVLLTKKKYYKDYAGRIISPFDDGYSFSGPYVEKVELIDDEATTKWINSRFTKLVCGIRNKEKLLNLAEKLDNDGIRYKLIFDACFTKLSAEESDGSCLTCLGIIPINRNDVPKYLHKLQLLD